MILACSNLRCRGRRTCVRNGSFPGGMEGRLAGAGKLVSRSCPEHCVQGRCSEAPSFRCLCELGWTGPRCEVDCGCNNHSSCDRGVGLCDRCHNLTRGQHCHLCRSVPFFLHCSSQRARRVSPKWPEFALTSLTLSIRKNNSLAVTTLPDCYGKLVPIFKLSFIG